MAKNTRFWEIDTARALGLVLMLVQHTAIVWSAVTRGVPNAAEVFDVIGHVGGWIFVLLVGVSAYLSFAKMSGKFSADVIFHRFLWRGLQLFGWALVVTVASILVVPESPILFGVLHFIGSVVMIVPFLIRFMLVRWAVIIGVPFLALLLNEVEVSSLGFLPFGLYPANFSSLDYWPLVPWLAVPAVGIELGQVLYPEGKRGFSVPQLQNKVVSAVAWIGRHTLVLYLIHIPALFILLSAVQYLVD